MQNTREKRKYCKYQVSFPKFMKHHSKKTDTRFFKIIRILTLMHMFSKPRFASLPSCYCAGSTALNRLHPWWRICWYLSCFKVFAMIHFGSRCKAWLKPPRAFIGGLAIALAGSLCDLEPAGFGVAAWSRLSHRASPEFWFRVSQFQNPVTSWPLLQFALPLALHFNFSGTLLGLHYNFFFLVSAGEPITWICLQLGRFRFPSLLGIRGLGI